VVKRTSEKFIFNSEEDIFLFSVKNKEYSNKIFTSSLIFFSSPEDVLKFKQG
jgi:hypothetical protein